jgi:hypothetical protein
MFIGLSFIPGMDKLIYLAIFPFLIATLLLIYAPVREIVSTTFVENEDVWEEPPSETSIKVDEQARQWAVESWRWRAIQDRHRRRNPSG